MVIFDGGRGLGLLDDGTCAERPGQETMVIRRRFEDLKRKLDGRDEAQELRCLQQMSERRRRTLKDMAQRDRLTGLYNRRYFEGEIKRMWNGAVDSGRPLSLVFIDLDHFKRINDTRGHRAGDKALQAGAGLIRSVCRRDDLVARYGGEEFVLLLPNTEAGEAAALAERMREAVRHIRVPGSGLGITASFGVTLARRGDLHARRLAAAQLKEPRHVAKLFAVLGPRYQERQGGYCRVLKAGFRYGDMAPMAIIELVDRDPEAKGKADRERLAAQEAAAS